MLLLEFNLFCYMQCELSLSSSCFILNLILHLNCVLIQDLHHSDQDLQARLQAELLISELYTYTYIYVFIYIRIHICTDRGSQNHHIYERSFVNGHTLHTHLHLRTLVRKYALHVLWNALYLRTHVRKFTQNITQMEP